MATAPVDHGQMNKQLSNTILNDGVHGTSVAMGILTLEADASTVVTDSNIVASSRVVIFPRNAAAGLLMRSNSVSALAGSGSFTVSVSATGAGAPAGTEQFSYVALSLTGL